MKDIRRFSGGYDFHLDRREIAFFTLVFLLCFFLFFLLGVLYGRKLNEVDQPIAQTVVRSDGVTETALPEDDVEKKKPPSKQTVERKRQEEKARLAAVKPPKPTPTVRREKPEKPLFSKDEGDFFDGEEEEFDAAPDRHVPPPVVKKAAAPSAAKDGKYTVQVASFKSGEEADELKKRLADKGYDAFVTSADLGDRGVWHRVRVGRFQTKGGSGESDAGDKKEGRNRRLRFGASVDGSDRQLTGLNSIPGHYRTWRQWYMNQKNIRNFCIIAHIDHGKSTLADRLLDLTGTLKNRDKVAQYLDRMDLERERGITIKLASVRMTYKRGGEVYELNLIDTPGHVDFSYEVSRSLKACEGAILVVDASQGVEAQTLANAYMASDVGLEIFPVMNKIDLPAADIERTRRDIEEGIGLDASQAVPVSAKEGTGVEEVLEKILSLFPPPAGDPDAPLKAVIFDSWFDPYQGAVSMVRVIDGRIKPGMKILLMNAKRTAEVQKVGAFMPEVTVLPELCAGEVGFVASGLKSVQDTKIGDTITDAQNPIERPLPGFLEVKPVVFSGLYPIDPNDYPALRDALEKPSLNDSSFVYEPETSEALGFGFRCGYLGLLHMEIVKERLEREFNLDLITTAPSVVYKVKPKKGEEKEVENPARIPDPGDIDTISEPFIEAHLLTPAEYVGPVIKLCEDKRGVQKEIRYVTDRRTEVIYELPLAEIVLDFYDKLKSATRGHASLDYHPVGYRAGDLVKLTIIINGEPVDALSLVVPREKAYYRGRDLIVKMKEYIPRQMYEVAIQAAVGNKVVARVTQKAFRKNVTAKCYGGDITRKRKLLEKQKAGKKRMKQVGNVEVPQEAFLAILKVDQ